MRKNYQPKMPVTRRSDGQPKNPKLKLDLHMIREAASIGCTNIEIARLCKCSTDTIERNHMDLLIEGRENGKMRLRKAQMETALSGNPTMQIFLGKVMLGQREDDNTDRQVTEIEIEIHPTRIRNEIDCKD